jgi:polysaccharide export outer membrane protein
MTLRALVVTLLFALLSLGAVAHAQQRTPQTVASAATPAPPTAAAPAYTLGPGDQLHIIVFGETDLTGEFTIGPNGTLAFPLIGEVPARGMTALQLGSAIEARLREGYVRAPRVSVSIAQYRPFYILGEVENPGTYPFSAELTVMSAVATAGGFTYRANRRRVFVRHAGESEEQAMRLTPETRVQPGDTIRIGERFF